MKELVLILLRDSVSAFVPNRFSNHDDRLLGSALAVSSNLAEAKRAIDGAVGKGEWLDPFLGYAVKDGKIDLTELIDSHRGGIVYIRSFVGDVDVISSIETTKIHDGWAIAVDVENHGIAFYEDKTE